MMKLIKSVLVMVVMLGGIFLIAGIINVVVSWASSSLLKMIIFTAVAGLVGYWFFKIEEEN